MATITVRNLDENIKKSLRIQSALHGQSMEAEVRDILAKALTPETEKESLASKISKIIQPIGGIDLEIPDREDNSEHRMPNFDPKSV